MKILKRLLIIILVLSVFIGALGGLYFRYFGRDFVQLVLSNTFKKNVMISNISYQFPFGINMSYVSIENVLFSKKVVIQADPLSAFSRKIRLYSVAFTEPVVDITKEAGERGYSLKRIPEGSIPMPDKKEVIAIVKEEEKKFDILINKVIILNGTVKFSNDDFHFKLTNVRLQADDVLVPLMDSNIGFNIAATLSEPEGFLSESRIKAKGRVNIVKKDMDATLEMVKGNKGDILSSKLLSRNNDMKVEGTIRFKRNILDEVKADKTPALVSNLLLGKLSSKVIEVDVHFSFRTKMDDFKIEKKVDLSGNIISK